MLDRQRLSLNQVAADSQRREQVALPGCASALEEIASRGRNNCAAGRTVYGVNTGFGNFPTFTSSLLSLNQFN